MSLVIGTYKRKDNTDDITSPAAGDEPAQMTGATILARGTVRNGYWEADMNHTS